MTFFFNVVQSSNTQTYFDKVSPNKAQALLKLSSLISRCSVSEKPFDHLVLHKQTVGMCHQVVTAQLP